MTKNREVKESPWRSPLWLNILVALWLTTTISLVVSWFHPKPEPLPPGWTMCDIGGVQIACGGTIATEQAAGARGTSN